MEDVTLKMRTQLVLYLYTNSI